MFKVASVVLLLCAALACAAPRVQQNRGLVAKNSVDSSGNHPYLFLTVPRGRSGAVVHGFEIVKEEDDDDDDDLTSANDAATHAIADDNDDEFDDDDDDAQDFGVQRNSALVNADNEQDDDAEDDAEEDDDDDDEEAFAENTHFNSKISAFANKQHNMQMILKNAKPTQMMVSRENAGAIMVPDGFIEIEGQSVVDEKTGKAALLVPRAALEAVPDGSVVALMERSLDETEEERANRVYVRRRRKGSRRNVRRRGGNGRRRRRRGGNKRRRGGGNRRRNVRRRGGKRRRNNVRVIQG